MHSTATVPHFLVLWRFIIGSIRTNAPDHGKMNHIIDISILEKQLKALANRRRLFIVKFLTESPAASVGEIADCLDLSIRSTSHHLAVLRTANVLETKKSGSLVYYLINPELSKLVRTVVSQV